MSKHVASGKHIGTAPTPAGRPKLVPDNVTVALVDLCKVLRSFQMPVFHTTVIAHFKRLTDGTELGRKFQKKSDDGMWDWHEGKLDNWYKRHFLGEHPELATGGQMSIDVARNNWCISNNIKYYFDVVETQLLRVTFGWFHGTRLYLLIRPVAHFLSTRLRTSTRTRMSTAEGTSPRWLRCSER